jgi:hypothetical protein
MSILGSATKPKLIAPVRMWIYGAPNAGKTHFAKQFPSPLLLSTDGNYVYEKIPANSLNAWEVGALAKNDSKDKAFINILQELKTVDQFDTIILDLVEGTYRLARNHYLSVLKIQHEGDLAYGKAYTIIRENFISAIEQLFKLPVNIIIISHETTERIEPKNAAPYTVFKPSLDDRFHSIFEGYCNLVGRIFIDIDDEGNRVRKLSLNPKEHEYGINRLGDTDDLILNHNGDNYGDFLKIWSKLYSNKGLGEYVASENTTRVEALKNKKEGSTDRLIKDAQRAQELNKEEIKVVVPNIVAVAVPAPLVQTIEELEDDEPEIVRTDSVNAKLAKIAELKLKRNNQ